MKNTSIHRVMTPAPAIVSPSSSVADAERLMRERHCHHVPVVEGRAVVGMLTAHDLVKALALQPEAGEQDSEILARAPLARLPVADIMQRHVRVITQTATLLDAARALATGGCHALPVVAADGHLVGIVTSTDLIGALADDLEHGTADRTAPARRQEPDATDVADPQIRALRDVFRAARNYLSSGQAEAEHTRLVRATDHARETLRSAGIDVSR